MKKNKKILIFLALNSIIASMGMGNTKEMKYDKLYNKIISNIETKKPNKENYKLIEKILNQRNKELKDLYLQGTYVVKPEYLEWQIFFSGFYENSHKKNNSVGKEVIGEYTKKPKTVSLGMYVPVRDVADFSAAPDVKTNGLTALNEPNPQNAGARDVSIFNIDIPQINLNIIPPSFNITTPTISEKNVKLTTNLQAPQVPLEDVKVFDLKLNQPTNPLNTNGAPNIPHTITSSSLEDSYLKVDITAGTFNALYATINIEKNGANGVWLEAKDVFIASTYGIINLKESNTSGLAVSPKYTGSGYNPNYDDYSATNHNSIVGETASTGIYTKQVGIGYIPSGARDIQVNMINSSTGTITMNSPNSAGFLLMPDVDVDPGLSAYSDISSYPGGRTSYDGGLGYADATDYDQKNVRQIATNAGVINIYGSRSYGFLTSPYGGNDMSHNFGISTRYANTSRIYNMGTINVFGDESTGFAIKKGIQHWTNTGIINIGSSAPLTQDNLNGNTIYLENGTPDNTNVSIPATGNATMVERATGMYTNQDTVQYTTDLNSGGPVDFYENQQSSAENSAAINIWQNATGSSGLRAEISGYVMNRGAINIYGDNNYGIVSRDSANSNQSGGRVYNMTYTAFNPGVYSILTNKWEVAEDLGKEAHINVNSNQSAGGYVDRGGYVYNTGYIDVIGNNSAGFYIKSGRAVNDDRTDDPANYHYGKISSTGTNSHGVIITNEDAGEAGFENRGVIETSAEGTVAVYAVNSSWIAHSQSGDKERHFVEDPRFPGTAISKADWLLIGGTISPEHGEYFGKLTLTTDYKQNALIKAGDGGIGIWLDQKNTAFSTASPVIGITNAAISAPIEVGNSTNNFTSIGVYSDGIARAAFNKGSIYDLNPVKYSKDIASIKVGTGGIALLHNYKGNAAETDSRKRFGSSSGIFEINALNADLGNDSILAYSNGGDIFTGDLSGVGFTNIGNDVTLAFSSNNGSITVNDSHLSDFLLNTGGVLVGTGLTPYIAENGEIKNTFTGTGASGINGIVLNTQVGLQSYSKNGTLVTMNKANTKTTNDGILNMKGNTGGVVAAYTKYGNLTNTVNGIINTNEINSTAMYGAIDSDITNNGIINTLGTGSVGIYSLSNDTSGTPLVTTGGINIINTGTISTSGDESAGIYAKKNGVITVNNKIDNSGRINVNSKDSVGIFADNVNITSVGTIDISSTLVSADGGRIAVYGGGSDSTITTTGADIRLGQIDQTQVAYYIADGATLSGTNLGTVSGYGVLILADNTVIGAGMPAVTAGNGQIGLALKGTNTIAYTGEIKSGNTVTVGTDKFYGIALYADKQNIASLTNKLTAGTNGVGLYAGGGTGAVGTGSDITYTGQIEVGDGINSGIGIYVKAGSKVDLASGGSIKVDGLGVGAYVEGNGEFTFGTGSSMTFTDSGIGIWGENGSIINDNGSAPIYSLSPTGSVTRSRVANGIINITGPLTMLGSGMAGFVTSGEVNNLAGSTIMSNVGTQGTTALAAEGYKTVGVNAYEANNFGIITLQDTDKGTGIYVKNARAYNDANAEISVGSNGVGIYAESDLAAEKAEIRNNGNVIMTGIQSIGLYGKGASLIENNGTLSSNIAGNIGIYNKENTVYPLSAVINNNNSIILADNGIGIYAEKSAVTNAGNITTGDKSGTGESVGIYVKDSTVVNTGNVKVGQNGVAFIGDNSTINISSGNIDVSGGSLAFGKNNSTINYNIGNATVTGVQPYISIADSVLNFTSPATLTVADNGTGIFVSGNTGTVTGSLNLDINNNVIGIYVKDLGTVYTSNAGININGTESRGLVLENSSAINTGSITVSRDKGVGVFSQLTQPGNNTTLDNTGTISVNAEGGRGIYALAEDSTGTVLGSTVVDNNGTILLGNSADINTSTQVGIYGTKGVTINNNSVIAGGANTVGIYSTGSTVSSNGSISVGDSSVGIYLDGGNLTTGLTTSISTGSNNGVGIYALNGSQVTNNSSSISAGKDSILMYAKGNGTVINNLADLEVQENGVGFYVNGGMVQNQGVLKATGANAIFLYGAAGEIQNSNLLNADGNDGVIGIYGKNTNILNAGDVITGNSVITSLNPTENTYSVGIYGNNSLVKNSGKITLGLDAVGIYVEDTPVTAENTGLIESSQHGAIGIFADNGTVQNKGTIILSGNNSIGMAGRANSTIINDGQIIINGNEGIGMYVTAGSHVYNNNIITINGDNGIGIQVGGGSILENSGTINLNGVNGQDIVIGEGEVYTLPKIINAGIINVNEKFEVSGVNVSVKVDPSTVRVPTIEEIASGGYNSEDLEGKFLISNSVQFNAESFDMREPVNIMDTFTQGTNSTAYKLENVFSSATAWAGSNGKISVISDSLTWDAIPSINSSGGIDIWMQKLDYTSFSEDHWYNDFAGILDGKYEYATGNAMKIYDKIDRIKTVEEFDHIMNSLSGSIYANINEREKDIAETFENSLYLLQDSENNTKENVKVNVIAGKGKTKDDTAGVYSYDYSTIGVVALREVERTYKNTLGYSLGYLHTGFEMNDNNSSEELVDTVQLGVHSKYSSNDWTLRNDLTGRVSFHNIDRNINWTDGRSEMNGNYETYSITSDNRLGKKILGGKNGSIVPYAAIKAMYVTRPTFQEDGLEAVKIDGNDAWSVKPNIGVELKASSNEIKNGWKIKGMIDLAYEYELANLNRQEKAKLVNIESGYYNLAKPAEEKGTFRTRAVIGIEAEDRYGIFINGEYRIGEKKEDDYRAGLTLKAVF
jgi:hypothetical protein